MYYSREKFVLKCSRFVCALAHSILFSAKVSAVLMRNRQNIFCVCVRIYLDKLSNADCIITAVIVSRLVACQECKAGVYPED
jgi:hypothetical protein